MDTLSAFVEMGGYARFVWPSFALTFAVLASLLVVSLRSLRRGEAELAALRAATGAAPADGPDEA